MVTPKEHAIIHLLQGDLYVGKEGNTGRKTTLGKHWKWRKKHNQLNANGGKK